MAQLICFSEGSGMPIFSKSLDASVKIPLPKATLLKTISTKLSGEAGSDVKLITAEAGGLSFYWKHACHGLSYVLVVRETEVGTAHHMEVLLTLVNHVMVMGLGKEKLGLTHTEVKKFTKSRNLDPPLNILLQCFSSCEVFTMADVTGYPDCSFPLRNQQEITGVLCDFLSVSGAKNGCLVYKASILAESKGWSTFSPTDVIVLILFAQSMDHSQITHQEFINTTSGVKSHMVVTKLTEFISLITIIEHRDGGDGARLDEEAIQGKRKQKNTFLAHVEEEKRRATDSVDLFLNNVVQGVLIVDHKKKKAWWTIHPELRHHEIKKKLQLLRKFSKEAKHTMSHKDLKISETYSHTLEAKFYALRQGNSECFLMFTADANHLQMREISKMIFRIAQDRLSLNQN